MEFPNTALFVRSLTVDNKRFLNYLLRWIMLILIGFSLLQYLFKSLVSAQMSAPGLEFFQYISNINLVFITLLGVTLFSSAVTEEKEVGSLGLLLMTGLTSFTLLLSKSTSKLVVGMMLITAQLPFSIMAVTLGGVSMRQILAVYMILLAYIFFLSNLALFFSVIMSRTYKAAGWTFFVLICFYAAALNYPEVAWFSPFMRTSHILTTGFGGSIISPQVMIMAAASLLLFTLSVIIFNYFTRVNSNKGPLRIPFSRKKRLRIFPVPRTWKNAISWKEFFFTAGGTFGILATTIVLALVMGYELYAASLNRSTGYEDIGMMFLITGALFFAIQCVYISSTIFNHEVEEKTYSTLIMLPLSIREIAYSKLLGSSVFLLPSLIVIVIGFFIASDAFRAIPLSMQSMGILTMIISGAIQFAFYLYLVTLFSLKIRYGGFVLAGVVFFVVQIGFGIPSMMIGVISAIPFGIVGKSVNEVFAIGTSVMTWALYVFAIIFTHRIIAKRLKALAAQ